MFPLAALLLSGCGAAFRVSDPAVISQDRDFLLVAAGRSDTLRSLAERYLDDPSLDWVIAEANHIKRVKPGQKVVIPRRPFNRSAVFGDGYQTVPILTYHRFASSDRNCGKLSVSKAAFRAQMAYLRDRGFEVISFADLAAFMAGDRSLPKKSVIITIDDGYRSTYEIAYPVLREFGFKATVFIYADFIGAPAGLTWDHMRKMVASGLIDIQPHSKTHADLTKKLEGEGQSAYEKRVLREIRYSTKVLRRLGLPMHTFSYPYGAENDLVVDLVKSEGFKMGVTVTRGGNPSFANPFMLRRTQIYCSNNVKTFAKRLEVFKRVALR
ncbi:MAG: polysaccharide deacetylase family protein [Kiloniellales bacterium]|nr:polysaccharide deacetylase family protein [Kiloniellales bacterium]